MAFSLSYSAGMKMFGATDPRVTHAHSPTISGPQLLVPQATVSQVFLDSYTESALLVSQHQEHGYPKS